MKLIKLSLVLLMTQSFRLFAQTPEPVYSFAKIHRSNEWNRTQRDLWKKEIARDSGNALAWYYVYRAQRNLNACDTTDKRSREEKAEWMNAWIDQMKQHVPNSYEYNLCVYAQAGLDNTKLSYLKKAEELGVNRIEHIDYSINNAEINRDMKARNTFAKIKYDAGDYSPGFLYYCYNLIIGLKPNALLVTTGDNDTYGIWILQSLGIRPDVTTLNLSLIAVPEYRRKLCQELNCDFFDEGRTFTEVVQKSGLDEWNKWSMQFIHNFQENKKHYPLYISVTVHPRLTNAFAGKLYLTGLAFEYSHVNLETISILQNNLEKKFKLDYICNDFYPDASRELVQAINKNYIVPFYTLWKHYKTAGDLNRMETMKAYLIYLLKNSPEESELLREISK
jgi:hypothetical protein